MVFAEESIYALLWCEYFKVAPQALFLCAIGGFLTVNLWLGYCYNTNVIVFLNTVFLEVSVNPLPDDLQRLSQVGRPTPG